MTSLKFRLREYAARPGVDVEAQVLLHDAANTIEELIGGREMTMRNMDSLHRQIAVLLLNSDPTAHLELATNGKGTPQSIAAAIVKAAVRVAGGEDESW